MHKVGFAPVKQLCRRGARANDAGIRAAIDFAELIKHLVDVHFSAVEKIVLVMGPAEYAHARFAVRGVPSG